MKLIRVPTQSQIRTKKMNTNDFSSSSSSSSPSDRRIGALLRHLTAGTDADRVSSVSASPTSGVTGGGSVFAHLVQAPEDAILGVYLPSLFFSFDVFVVCV